MSDQPVGLMSDILPARVSLTERFNDDLPAELFPSEEAAMCRAVSSRRREFATGRSCARESMRRLGIPPGPLPRGERGVPVWPEGISGSITHCDGYRAAAVARTVDAVSVGIDAEANEPLPQGVSRLVMSPAEAARLRHLPRGSVSWDRLVFSAKECVYKAWFPLMRSFLDFSDADVSLAMGAESTNTTCGKFIARVSAPGLTHSRSLHVMRGAWAVREDLILTAVVLPAADQTERFHVRLPGGSAREVM